MKVSEQFKYFLGTFNRKKEKIEKEKQQIEKHKQTSFILYEITTYVVGTYKNVYIMKIIIVHMSKR